MRDCVIVYLLVNPKRTVFGSNESNAVFFYEHYSMKNTAFDSFKPKAVLFGSRSIDEKIYNHASINKSKLLS